MSAPAAISIASQTLTRVLTKMLDTAIINADYQTEQLHGGTLGDVRLVTGLATAATGQRLPYQVILKTQKRWQRPGDPNSWRREYDLYSSDLGTLFTDSCRWPTCYQAEMYQDEIQLWLEYIDGVSGLKLSGDMYRRAAEELGKFQGRLAAEQPIQLRNLSNLSQIDYAKNFYQRYRSWPVVYDYIRSDDCEIPQHLCAMLINVDDNADEIFSRIAELPVVLCHRDFWVTNIFFMDGKIVLIDWDTCGWGYLGEDVASLIADEADVEHMVEYYHDCVQAYYRGFTQYAEASVADHCIHELILVMFGYRLVEWYLAAKSPAEKTRHLNTLQKIYEMKPGRPIYEPRQCPRTT